MGSSWAHKVLLITAVIYTSLLTWGSLTTVTGGPEMPDNFDKVIHFTAYLGLALLWLLVLWKRRTSDQELPRTFIAVVIFITILYGIIIELLQGRFTPDRIPDAWDVLANTFGVLIGAFIFTRIFNKSERLKSIF